MVSQGLTRLISKYVLLNKSERMSGIKLLKYFFSHSQPHRVFGEKFPNYITFLFLPRTSKWRPSERTERVWREGKCGVWARWTERCRTGVGVDLSLLVWVTLLGLFLCVVSWSFLSPADTIIPLATFGSVWFLYSFFVMSSLPVLHVVWGVFVGSLIRLRFYQGLLF